MADLPEVQSWIKFIYQPSGKSIPSGSFVYSHPAGKITIRYVFANDSNQATGAFTVAGGLSRDGVKLSNPIPAQTIQLQPKELWKYEHVVSLSQTGLYQASLIGDVGNYVNEEDESNNIVKGSFTCLFLVP